MADSARLISRAADFRAALHAWYRTAARPLPWRTSPSLYQTVVSEFMLQQTQVKTVLPYFARWLEMLPDFAALAAAPEAKVLKLWEGLGYYSRARNLHRLAQAIVARTEPPRTPEAWRELPGVGPYTAAAITSIAFGAPAAVVDGNVVRILARLTADDRTFKDGVTAAKAFADLAQSLISAEGAGDHNQAMMELGATVCVRQNPLCTVCPVFAFCAARKAGDPAQFPRLASKPSIALTVTRVWCVHRGRLLLHRADAGARRLAAQHELPTAEQAGLSVDRATKGELLAQRKRGITKYRITESIYRVGPKAVPGKTPQGLVWVPLKALHEITLSGPHRRWVGEILAAHAEARRPRRF
ncbi:MAG: A/G-specific adenine glycosylase [Alphaproteobacteria bacterium]|nr:MAG: A/G-specific adenine glycosylase [Alphaproteobacteria bacterium]